MICLAIFVLAYVTNAMDRMVFPMLVPWISKSYSYGLKDAGLLATAFTLGIGAMSWPIGCVLDRYSRKPILLAGMVIYSIFTLATIFATGFWDMLVYRALTGVGESMQVAALFSAACSYFPKYKATVIGTINFGYAVGATIGPLFGTKLTMATDNWHTPFIVYTVVGLVMAGVIWLFIPKEFSEAKEERPDHGAASVAAVHVPTNFWNRNCLMGIAGAVCMGITGYAYLSLYTTFLIKELHFEPLVAGGALSFFGAGTAFGMFGGWVADHFPLKWVAVAVWALFMVDTFLLFNGATAVWEHYALSFVVGITGSSMLFPVTMSLIQRSVQAEMIGRASGSFLTALFFSAGLSGYLFGGFVEAVGWSHAGIYLEGGCSLIAIVAMLTVATQRLR